MASLLDANVFIQAARDYYPFDVAPGFWEWLDREHQNGELFSIEKVGQELTDYDDELAQWARGRMGGFFLRPDDAVVTSLQSTSTWANGAGYMEAAIATFFDSADYYLVSHAHAHGHTVVTHEKPRNTPSKIQIPNACAGINVPCMGFFDLLKTSRLRLVLPR